MSDYLACAAGCTIRDEHRSSCASETCGGCLPKPAQFGCLCARDWYALELAWSEWAILEPYLSRYARLSPRNEAGGRIPPGPSIPLPQTALAWDEVRSWLRSEPQDARAWVSTIVGAQQAVGFTRAVQAAVRAHQIEEKQRKLQRFRCTCGQLVVWVPPRNFGDKLTVQCESCGRVVTEDEQFTAYRRTPSGWEAYGQPAIEVISSIEERKA